MAGVPLKIQPTGFGRNDRPPSAVNQKTILPQLPFDAIQAGSQTQTAGERGMQQAFRQNLHPVRIEILRGEIGAEPIGVPRPNQGVFALPNEVTASIGEWRPLPDLKLQRLDALRLGNALEIETAKSVEGAAHHPLDSPQLAGRGNKRFQAPAITPRRQSQGGQCAQEGKELLLHQRTSWSHRFS